MKKIVLILALFLVIVTPAFSEVGVFVKIAIDSKHYSSLIVTKPENLKGKFRFIARKIKENTFDFTKVNKDFYQINIKQNINYLEKPIKIYQIKPAFNDRFIHVIWVVDDVIVRREVYNLNKKLFLAYGYIDTLPEIVYQKKTIIKQSNEKYLKENFDIFPHEYKGFKILRSKKSHPGLKHFLFTDGLNSFSVFIQVSRNIDQQVLNKATTRIIMGNNILREKSNNKIYTIVGTIPFEEMKKIIAYINNNKEEFLK
jgi:sigma-E factor negative regulatory protein RseB